MLGGAGGGSAPSLFIQVAVDGRGYALNGVALPSGLRLGNRQGAESLGQFLFSHELAI